MKHIGWIGLGKMGVPMSRQLLKAGYTLSVYNRTREKEKALIKEGASRAASPKALLEEAEVVFLMVSDDEAIREIFEGEEGLLRAETTGKVIVNMSTVSPDISREMGDRCRPENEYLDAPVSGSVPQAESQQLAIIVGGKKSAFEKVTPLLNHLGKSTIHVGATGTGNAAKLAVNTFLGIMTEGLAEVIDFANQIDVEIEDLMTIINNSSLGSPFVKMKGEAVLQNDYDAAFTLTHLDKDLRLARESGFNGQVGNEVGKLYREAEPSLGEKDVIAILQHLQRKRKKAEG